MHYENVLAVSKTVVHSIALVKSMYKFSCKVQFLSLGFAIFHLQHFGESNDFYQTSIGILFFKYTGASFFRHFETRRYLWYLIHCSIVTHPNCLNKGADGAMGSWYNINLVVLFCNLRMRCSPSLEQFP